MRHIYQKSVLAVGILMGMVYTKAYGAPNGLNQIPIAKIYGDGGVALSFAQSDLGTPASVFTTQYGLYNICEVGIDYQAALNDQQEFLGNGKILLFHKPGYLPDIAAGVENVADNQRAVPYLVATIQPPSLGISFGVIRPVENGYEAMGGVSYNISSATQIVTDTIRGWSNYSTIGFITNVTPSIQVNVAYASPNESMGGQNPDGYILNITYVFHIKGGGVSRGKDLTTKGGIIKTGTVKPVPNSSENSGSTSGDSTTSTGGK